MAPAQILDELPLTDEQAGVVLRGRSDVHAILDGVDDRLLVVVGPCSVHDIDAALDYRRRLSVQAEELQEDLCVTMRVYFEKPRTTTGWKGMINDPQLDGSRDVNAGLHMARGLLLEVLGLGVPVGCEFLDPITPQYISDAVAWGAIGARPPRARSTASSGLASRCRSASRGRTRAGGGSGSRWCARRLRPRRPASAMYWGRDQFQELGARGDPAPYLQQQAPRHAQPSVDVAGPIQLGIVDQALPADRGARLLEVHAHGQQSLPACRFAWLLSRRHIPAPPRGRGRSRGPT